MTDKSALSDKLLASPQSFLAHSCWAFERRHSRHRSPWACIHQDKSSAANGEFLIFEAEDDNWSNPVHWKRHSIRPGHHLPRDVSDQTVSQLLAVIEDPRDRALFELMVNAGLRVGEVVDLQLNDLHPLEQNGLARLRVCGKGDKDRIVWLTAEVVHHIQHWQHQRPQSESSYLFLNQHHHPLSISGVQLSCHQLRHTFARRLVESIVWPSCWDTLIYRRPNVILMGPTQLYEPIFLKRYNKWPNYLAHRLNKQPTGQPPHRLCLHNLIGGLTRSL